ncbi:hypothetical protein KUTeg_020491 [Tegillarca granosa]|uniref:HMG box-containing protein 1 n=1 Tax=Tegillarca granosa TaxID=220873 RepID=A0ABQ9E817_TEGGR|nr:hypothetical protein KUTeg_020491 [Tegillarca granosa]
MWGRRNYFSDGSDPRVTSSSPFPTSPKNLSSPTDTWSHQWPTAVWQCFTEGKCTRIHFLNDSGNEWKKVEDLAQLESLQESASWTDGSNNSENRYGHGLKLLRIDHHQNVDNIKESVTQLHFTSNIPSEPDLIAECSLDHPFFVKDKGWSSYHPNFTAEHYGIPCNILEVNDVCLPPTHPDAVLGDDMLESFISSDLTPMDSSAVFTLQNMAKQRRDLELSPKSNPGSPTKKRLPKTEPSKAKRPMNAFMLFAKEFRLEYTQKYPGKDNRAISVMLGDTWKKMNMQERNLYAEKARSLADVQKKMYPDCWKRKK